MRRFLMIIALLTICYAGLFSQSESIVRMKSDVMTLTSDTFLGREVGSPGEKGAAIEIARQFEAAELVLMYPADRGQSFSYAISERDTLHSQNVVAIVEGWDPKLKHEYIVVGAHYDHLGHMVTNIDSKDSVQIFRGADDNASGVAVMLELARLVNMESINFRRSVIFVAFGGEEIGMTGSWYFANLGFEYIDKVVMMVNLDMVGRGADRSSVDAYTIVRNAQLTGILNDVSDMPMMISPNIAESDYFPSDHRYFSMKGISTVLFTTGLHSDYHSVRDTQEKLNFNVMEDIVQYNLSLLKVVANMDHPLMKTSGNEELVREDGVYMQNEVEKRATFRRGDERSFLEGWVYRYIKYPDSAVEEGVQGRVSVEFIVEKSGEVTNVNIVNSVDERLDAEVLKVVKASPKWRPATINKEPVRVKTSIPVEFKLTKERGIRFKR